MHRGQREEDRAFWHRTAHSQGFRKSTRFSDYTVIERQFDHASSLCRSSSWTIQRHVAPRHLDPLWVIILLAIVLRGAVMAREIGCVRRPRQLSAPGPVAGLGRWLRLQQAAHGLSASALSPLAGPVVCRTAMRRSPRSRSCTCHPGSRHGLVDGNGRPRFGPFASSGDRSPRSSSLAIPFFCGKAAR